MEKSLREQASIWGQVFEIAVQRGVIAYLLHRGLLKPDNPTLKPWQGVKISHLARSVITGLHITDQKAAEWVESKIGHLLLFGYGLGWTTLREWCKQINASQYDMAAVWCPLVLPGTDRDGERERTIAAFQNTFSKIYDDRSFPDPGLVGKGRAGRADFLLWLQSKTQKKGDEILCL